MLKEMTSASLDIERGVWGALTSGKLTGMIKGTFSFIHFCKACLATFCTNLVFTYGSSEN